MEKGTGISIKMRRTIMGKWRNYVEKLKETCKNNKKKVIGICTGLVLVLSIGGVSYAINIQDTGATVDKKVATTIDKETQNGSSTIKNNSKKGNDEKTSDTITSNSEEKKTIQKKSEDKETDVATEKSVSQEQKVESKNETSTSSKETKTSEKDKKTTTTSKKTNSATSGSNSSSKSNSSSSGSNSSSNKTNNSGASESGSSSSSAAKPSHTHNWVAVTKTVNHEETGHYESVKVSDEWTEYIPVYETIEKEICNTCGVDITSDYDAHLKAHALNGENASRRTEYKQIQTGTNVVTHPAEYNQQWVKDSDAWTETVTTGYKCSCGATK